ncbi:MAG: DUF928 domain-containing protein [Cyanobacteria bacterium J055]|nr:MAG: DUF928 domain-containing protein [Cyanobacteria bacterium J055]
MAWNKSLSIVTALSLGMCLEVATLAISAQAGVSTSTTPKTWQVSQFNPPDRGAPTTAVGGATRGEPLCGEILALSPEVDIQDQANQKAYLGLTVSSQPSLLFYTKGSQEYIGEEVTFVLTDLNGPGKGDNKDIYETTFNLPDRSGMIAINIPSEVVLEEGKSYEWYMEMGCPTGAVEVSWMNGFVERIEETSTLKNQLAVAQTSIEKSKAYGDAGIWFEALDTLAEARRNSDTPDLESSWKSLLEYAAIKVEDSMKESIVNAEFLDCCSLESASDDPDLTTHN